MNLLVFTTFIVLVYLLSYLPGRLIVQLLPLKSNEKFVLSFGVSFFLYYLLGFFQYIFNFPFFWGYLFLLSLVICLSFFLYTNKKLSLPSLEIKLLGIFFLGFLFVTSIQALQPYYSGGGSYWDWYEYYFRSQFFFNHLSPFTAIGNTFLPQRMPLYHGATSFFMSIFGNGFWVIQPINSLFNMSALLSCFLICSEYLLPKKRQITLFIIVMSLLLLNLHFVAQSTYPWTKAMTAYYILVGLYFFLKNYKEKSKLSIYLGLIFLAMGHLVHQVSFTYIFVVALGFLIVSIKHKQFTHFFLALLIHLILLSTWYIWAYFTFGSSLTIASAQIVTETKNIPIGAKLDILFYDVEQTVLPVLNQYSWNKISNDKNFFVFFYDFVYLFWGATMPSAISFSVSIPLIYFTSIKLIYIVRSGFHHFKIKFDHIILAFFILSGFLPLWYSTKGSGAAGLMLLPSTLLLICFGVYAINHFAKKIGSKFIYLFSFFIIIESMIGVGTKALVPKFFLDPNVNKDIDMKRDLYDLSQDQQYKGFAVHLKNYTLKTDNHLILLYDKFADLQPFFVLVFITLWITLVGMLVRSLFILAHQD
ncbi:hypothetical protein HY029_06255 [Candidatus Gottesmanbacteria bacterium]|nr:hypothetical protein [Candidatus Gottesmanbacteria bacterium]